MKLGAMNYSFKKKAVWFFIMPDITWIHRTKDLSRSPPKDPPMCFPTYLLFEIDEREKTEILAKSH